MADPLIIKDWQNGMADSVHLGFGLMRNVDIESFPGAAKVTKKLTSLFAANFSTTFTANAGTDTLTTASSLNLVTARAITATSTGTLPAPLVSGTIYFVIGVGANTNKLATTIANANAGTPIDITDTGSGTHTMTSVNPGTINFIAEDSRVGRKFLHDSNGRVWYSTSGSGIANLLNGNTLTASSGKGLCLFRNSDGSATYLFVFRNQLIDVANVTGTSQIENPSWTSAWETMKSGSGATNSHFVIVGQDNIIYYCDDRYIGSIQEVPGQVFDPSNGATFNWSQVALTLPQGELTDALEELGVNLIIGGTQSNKLYPWDRSSSSYNLPVPMPEYGIYGLKNIGNLVYILCGTKGNIYSTQGTYARIVRRIPESISNPTGAVTGSPITWGGMGIKNNALVVGAGFTVPGGGGVFLLYPDGRLIQDNTPSIGSANPVSIFATNDAYFIGYASGSDYVDTSTRYSSFDSVIQSALYRIGNKTQKATFSQVEVQIARPTTTGHIRIRYRFDDSSSFSDFATVASYTCNSVDTSFTTDIGLTDIENIQIQVEYDGDVEIQEVRLNP